MATRRQGRSTARGIGRSGTTPPFSSYGDGAAPTDSGDAEATDLAAPADGHEEVADGDPVVAPFQDIAAVVTSDVEASAAGHLMDSVARDALLSRQPADENPESGGENATPETTSFESTSVETSLPEIDLPENTLPEITLPEIAAPDAPSPPVAVEEAADPIDAVASPAAAMPSPPDEPVPEDDATVPDVLMPSEIETAIASAQPVVPQTQRAAALSALTEMTAANDTLSAFLRNEGIATVAHWRALTTAKSPGDAIRLQVTEFQRAADASLNCMASLARRAGRIAGTFGRG